MYDFVHVYLKTLPFLYGQSCLRHHHDRHNCLTGASVVGINCNFGPTVSLKSMRSVKEGLDKAGLSPHLIVQPLGYFTPDVERNEGYLQLPEAPFGESF